MAGLLDYFSSPEGIGTLLAGIGTVGTQGSGVDDIMAMRAQRQNMAMKRQAMEDAQKRREALARLPSLLGAFTGEDTAPADASYQGVDDMGVPTGPARAAQVMGPGQGPSKSEALGLLAQIAPDTAVHGLFEAIVNGSGSRRGAPAAIQEMQALGLPLTPDGFAQYNKLKATANGGDLKGLLDSLNILKLKGDISDAATKRDKEATDTKQDFQTKERSANRSLDDLFELADLNGKVKDGPLQPGLPFPEWRRAIVSGKVAFAESLGAKDQDKLREQIGYYDRLRKGLNNIIINNTQRFGSNFTNQMETLLENASANPAIMPEAIDNILGQLSERLVDDSEIHGYDLKSRDKALDFIKQMKASKPTGPKPVVDLTDSVTDAKGAYDTAKGAVSSAIDKATAAAPGVIAGAKGALDTAAGVVKPMMLRAADLGRLTKEKIAALNEQDIAKMTAEQKTALHKRMKDLGLIQ
jgi:hypothetical protein